MSALSFNDAARLFEVAGVNILLSGDNAVVVGMAIRNLPAAQRKVASAVGISGAMLVQTAATLTVASLLEYPVVLLAGGFLLVWIAIRLLRDNGNAQETVRCGRTDQDLHRSIITVAGAYLVMCLDNTLAIAAVGRGYPALLVFGLLLSAALLVPASLLIANLMKRYPVTLAVGAGILGWTAGSMIAAVLSPLGESLCVRFTQLITSVVMTVVVVTSPLWWRPNGRDAQPGQSF